MAQPASHYIFQQKFQEANVMNWMLSQYIVEFHCIVTEIDRNWYIFVKSYF